MRLPSFNRLLQISGLVGIGLVGSTFWFKNYLANKMTELEYYKIAMSTLQGNAAAMRLLGEPLKERRIDISDTDGTKTRPHRAQMKVPIQGSKQRGELYLWAERHALDVPWELLRLELGLEAHRDKRLLVYYNPKYAKDYVKDFDVDTMPLVASTESTQPRSVPSS
ncbi:hypothetical protein HPB51_014341 [Rhipicephalus microplus]|uniref:Cytochrome oxidase complex assembly protein 1 n=1 Tax=Rhipicephalus microplus TaxID=6941 RepID=A0A9J6EPN7_RHIMP|nr:uncharacterized protein LOC119180704 [Rhipicephalus microplus]KAH8035984.1 hypothetical protein HPB51_014341 [Rhipicephalus microplus]